MIPAYYKEESVLHYGEYLRRLKKWNNPFMYDFNTFSELLPSHLRSKANELYHLPPSHEFTIHAALYCQTVQQVVEFKEEFCKLCERVAREKLEWYFN